MTSVWLNYINSFWLFRIFIKACFCKRKSRDISRTFIFQFFDALKTKGRKIRGNCNLLIKVKFHELEWSSPWKCHGLSSIVIKRTRTKLFSYVCIKKKNKAYTLTFQDNKFIKYLYRKCFNRTNLVC